MHRGSLRRLRSRHFVLRLRCGNESVSRYCLQSRRLRSGCRLRRRRRLGSVRDLRKKRKGKGNRQCPYNRSS
ncbi:hypothetical protein HMPREF0860_0662 [Treponema socranskii subsp. socranskii VPI DR56BR1116 = ATCC 35536]|uniref:Lipoprotein n=1 Tax=Treponema socranskii subsp. socranskii VPI DR56BR1116 = ATCC 35536 TaxID=1125725 RepID=A0ABN0P8Z8_TRESO|nr:hypothetical protein HMPREF0860_0662 [Treponema socranskii subsp. socranskii VPI DR56BR1116 = ATCC 35536]